MAFFTKWQAFKIPLSCHGLIAYFFSVLNNIPLSACTSLFIYSPTEGHLGCFHIPVIINKAAVSIHVQVVVDLLSTPIGKHQGV